MQNVTDDDEILIYLTGNYSEEALDLDCDGYYDFLEICVKLLPSISDPTGKTKGIEFPPGSDYLSTLHRGINFLAIGKMSLVGRIRTNPIHWFIGL